MTRLPPSPLSHTRPQGTCDGVSPRKSRHLGATAGQAVALDRPPRSRAIWHDGRSREKCDRGFWQVAGFARIRAGGKRPHSGECGWPAHATESLQRSSEPPFFGVATPARETPCGAASGSRLPAGRLREMTSRLQEETGSRDCQCTRMDSAARPALLPLSSVTIRMKRILRTTNHAALQDAADLVRFSCPVLTANLD